MGTPFNLDPPNGDYVKYIENIQKGKIVPADGLPVPEESVHYHPMVDPAGQASNAANPSSSARKRTYNGPVIKRLLGIFLAVCGISSIACGILLGLEDLIPAGMFITFGAFILINQKNRN